MSRSTKWRESNRLLMAELDEEFNVSESDNSAGLCIAYCDSEICDYSSAICFTDSSDEDCNTHENFDENQTTLASDLRNWAAEYNCTQSSVTALLKILGKHNIEGLPLDSRTLLKTPRIVSQLELFGGKNIYVGLKENIITGLKILEKDDEDVAEIKLIVNVDGVPLFKSSDHQIRPILCSFKNVKPFLVAVFYGNSKPDSSNDFLRDFLNEYSLLKQIGISYNGHVLPVSINFFCCDAPARAFLKKIKNHTGCNSCERCVVYGEYEGRVVFHESACTLRNDADFSMGLYPEHQLGRSNPLDFEISCVKMFVLDPMHLVYLGVVRRMTSFWIEGPRICRMNFQQLNRISLNLLNLNGKLPSEFARQPRSLDVFKRWKATEWRHFLLYTGPVVLKVVLFQYYLAMACP